MQSNDQGGPDRPVFDRVEWEYVKRGVSAMFAGDANGLGRELVAMYTALDHSRRTSVYVRYALRYQSAVRAGKVPTRADLGAVAARAAGRYDPYVKDGAAGLDEILETVWGYREPGPRTTGSNFQVHGCIALAALLDNPTDLDAIEAPMQGWLAAHEDELTELFR